MAANPRPGELTSWKQIAGYLDVTERTAQLWARGRDLPVRRWGTGTGRRGHPYALTTELDAWKESQSAQTSRRRPSRLLGFYAIRTTSGLALIALIALVAVIWSRSRQGVPVSCRIDGQTLVAMDATGIELWRRSFADGFSEGLYDSAGLARRTWFGDLAGDGKTEVLFLYHQALLWKSRSTVLICYSQSGEEKWRWTAGRKLPELDPEPPAFLTVGLGVLRGKPGAPSRVVVSSLHMPYYPHQVAILDSKGKTLSEYWHSGHLDHMALADLDGDGREEILLAGVNNGYRQATFVVLDSDRVSGASLEAARPEIQLHGFGDPHERARFLLPRSCLSNKFETYNWVQEMSVTGTTVRLATGECKMHLSCEIWYQFDGNLRLVSSLVDDGFRSTHKDLFARHIIDHSLDTVEERAHDAIRCLAGCGGEFVPLHR